MDLLKSIFKGDKVIWIIFLFLCLISITEVFSAASTLTYKKWRPLGAYHSAQHYPNGGRCDCGTYAQHSL